jgi:hypothetical protein
MAFHQLDSDRQPNALTVLFEGRAVVDAWGELDHLLPACACTLHKSQESEDPNAL